MSTNTMRYHNPQRPKTNPQRPKTNPQRPKTFPKIPHLTKDLINKLTFVAVILKELNNMGKTELILPKMGESIVEATIIKWHKKVGDTIEQDEVILEVATDKVDSEVPSPFAGKLLEIKYFEDAVVPIGDVLAIIETEGEGEIAAPETTELSVPVSEEETPGPEQIEESLMKPLEAASIAVPAENKAIEYNKSERFYTPLVRNIAKEEGISLDELESINGSGQDGRLTKDDLLTYIESRGNKSQPAPVVKAAPAATTTIAPKSTTSYPLPGGDFEIEQMDRMRKMIADHMVASKDIAPHVSSFVESDVTNVVLWREKNKDIFQKKYGEKLTYTPIFIEAVVKALKDFPKINCSISDDKVYIYKDYNVGMATALPTGNLIVPVIRKAQHLSLEGITAQVNDLARRARENKLKPDDIKDGTFTITNIGTFGNIMGIPIINQPQAAILALGAIRKKPVVLETETGDVIAIRHMMYLSMSYDHRFIDGFLGGSFLKRVGDYIEKFDINRIV